ncbi:MULTISPECIES: hypothetical protein [unclassified Actinotalea]|uniref:hypothetical protein n=1 Tax=unclassified Actinotalea TaxID=2638618 RepID=UPI0015F420F4|nr:MULTISPECIES: hypothetical protein [unclassified Actinotalea]
MTIAALVISLLALAVAVAAAWYTRRQAKAASGTLALEEARRHDEVVPRISGEVERLKHAAPYARLCLRLETSPALTELRVRLLDAPVDVQFSSGQLGIDTSSRSPHHEAFAPVHNGVALKPFDRATWQLELNDVSQQRLQIQADAAVGDEWWSVLVTVDVPPPTPN